MAMGNSMQQQGAVQVCMARLLVEPRTTEMCDRRACGGWWWLSDAWMQPNFLSDRGITHLDWLANEHDRVAAACEFPRSVTRWTVTVNRFVLGGF